jgi:hypothetical protein
MSGACHMLVSPKGETVDAIVARCLTAEARGAAVVFLAQNDAFYPYYRYVARRRWQHETIEDGAGVVILLARPWKIACFEALSYGRWIAGAAALALASWIA